MWREKEKERTRVPTVWGGPPPNDMKKTILQEATQIIRRPSGRATMMGWGGKNGGVYG